MNHYPINSYQAEKILREHVDELSEPLKSAVEFTLLNWYKIVNTTSEAVAAKNFLASLSTIPHNRHEASQEVIQNLNDAMAVLRNDKSVWLSVEDLPHEVWRDIVGYEGQYKVSNFARVKSFLNGRVKILKDSDNGRGYMLVSLSKNKKHKMFTLHTLVARHFIPNPHDKPEVNHYYGKGNDCVWALEWVTPSENGFHAYAVGFNHTSRPKNAKLNDDDVRFIREFYKPNDKQYGANVLAKKFGVDASSIRRTAYGQLYKSVR